MLRSLVGSEMCIRDSHSTHYRSQCTIPSMSTLSESSSDQFSEDEVPSQTWPKLIPIEIPDPLPAPDSASPLDPRAQTHIPLQVRRNASLTNKLRVRLPRKIPTKDSTLIPEQQPCSRSQPPGWSASPGSSRSSKDEQRIANSSCKPGKTQSCQKS